MRKRIGEFLLDKGVVTPAQIRQILKYSSEHGLRFGEAAMEMGMVSRDQLEQLFGPNFSVDFFHLEPQYFPQVTKDLFSVELMVRLGALPLGFKTESRFFRTRKILNLGLLDPARRDAVDEASRAAVEKLGNREVQGVKVFLVLADQFLAILDQTYGMKEAQLRALEPAHVDGALSMFLEQGR